MSPTSHLNPYRTEKKSSLQDSSGFSEPLRRARIFDEFAVYENEFLYLKITKKLSVKIKLSENIYKYIYKIYWSKNFSY